MDESYRNRHRAAWEQRRAAEAAERQAAAAAAATTAPGGGGLATGRSSEGPRSRVESPAAASEQQQPQQQQSQVSGAASSPTRTSSSSQPPLLGAPTAPSGGLSGGAAKGGPTPAMSDEEALSEAAARRLQAEFDAVDEVRQPDASYQECLLGGHEDVWDAPRGAPPLAGSVPDAFGLAGGFRAAAAAVQGLQCTLPFGGAPGAPSPGGPSGAAGDDFSSDAELAWRLQEEENRRAQRLRQQQPVLRPEGALSPGGPPTPGVAGAPFGNPLGASPIPIEPDPLGLEEFAPAASRRGPRGMRSPSEARGPQGPPALGRSPRSGSPDVVEIPPPQQQRASDVEAAAAEAGIQVDPEEAVLQAAIAQSLVDM
ncbi:hypothetical protein Efla_007099 [Eimeria flavescens]